MFAEKVLTTPGMLDSLIEKFNSGRKYLVDSLDINGYRHKGEAGNFIFIEPKTDAQTIVDRMKAEKKILIKAYPNVGEFGNCLRVSIGEEKYGFDVNVLIVGDSIAEGGQGENGWCTLLQNNLRKTYNNRVSFTNVSMGGNASYAGYVRTMALDDDVGYDLAIICYGQNDGADGFSTNYESIIRAIRSKYPDCSIISILESSRREYTEKMTTIQSICGKRQN